MITVDARGFSCPIPVVMVQKEVSASAPAELEVLVDARVAMENITRFGRSQGYSVSVSEDGDDYRLILSR